MVRNSKGIASGSFVLPTPAVRVTGLDGEQWWFNSSESEYWRSGVLGHEGLLFRIGGKWIVLGEMDAMLGGSAKVVREWEALQWFLRSGFLPPTELTAFAEPLQLK